MCPQTPIVNVPTYSYMITIQCILGKNIGNCLTSFKGNFWCYISSTSQCSDKKESARAPGLFYSFEGCEGSRKEEPFPLNQESSSCECSDLLLQDNESGDHLGNCFTSNEGKYWCYVPANSSCDDKQESPRAHGLFYSMKACDGKRSDKPFPFLGRGNVVRK